MQERGEGYTPSEAEDFSMKWDSRTGTYGPTTEEGRQAMRGSPEAEGTPVNRMGLDGNLITPEKTEHYHGPETTKEIEVGIGPNPSWSSDPNDAAMSESKDHDSDATVEI